jgi:O-acetylserine/cysteine efflux transporter
MASVDCGWVLLVMAIWGGNYAIAKLGLLELPPFLLLATRFFLVGGLTVPFAGTPRRHLPQLLTLSVVFGTLHFGLVYLGLTRVDAATGAVLVQLQVPFAAIISFWLLGDRPGWRWLVGASLAFLGALILLGAPRLSTSLGHALLIILSAVMWAASYLQLKGMQKPGPITPFSVNAWMSLFTAPQLLVLSLVFEHDQLPALRMLSVTGWASLAYQVLFTGILAYALWYRLVARYPVSTVSPFTLTIPVFSSLAGALLLGEPITGRFMAGAGLTLWGVGSLMRGTKPPAQSAVPTDSRRGA